jgi:hypothetical protein
MRTTPIPPPEARAADARTASPAPPGASPGDFAALLDQTTARTAPAEGPQTRPARDAQARSRRDAERRPEDDDAPATTPEAAQAEATAAAPQAPTAQQPATSDAPADGAGAPGGDTAAQDAPPTLYTAIDPTALGAGGPAPAEPVAAGLPGVPGVPGLPGAPGAPGVPALPVAPAAAEPHAAPGPGPAPAAGPGLVIPAELLGGKPEADAKGHGGKDDKNTPDLAALSKAATPDGDGAPAIAPVPPAAAAAAPASAPAPAPAPDAAPTSAPGPAPAPAVVAVAQPAATPATAVPVAQGTPHLTRASVDAAVDRVQDLVRIAASRAGGARAMMQLKPVELGTVDVHLRTTREGLVATIAAHDQAGLDALQQAGPELRRTLEDRGVNVARLDLQLSAGQSGLGSGADARQASSGSGRGRSTGPVPEDGVAEDELTVTTVPSQSAGVLVDVQA